MAAAAMDMTTRPGTAAILMLRGTILRPEDRLVRVANGLQSSNRSDGPPSRLGSVDADGRTYCEHQKAQQEQNPSHRRGG